MSLTQAVEERIAKGRITEAYQNSIKQRLKDIEICAGHPLSEKKVEAMIMAGRQKQIADELKANEEFIATQQAEAVRIKTTALEEQIGNELSRMAAEKLRVDTEKMRVCAMDETIINLKKKLAVAEMNKARKVMHADTIRRQAEEKAAEEKEFWANEKMLQAMDNGPAQIRLDTAMKCKKDQQEQIRWKQSQRDFSMIEACRERAQVDEIVAKIADEDRMTDEAKKAFQIAAAKELNDFREHKAAFDADQRKKEAQEDADREAYAQKKRDDEKRLQDEKEAAAEAARKAFFSNIQMLEQQSNDAAELEFLINELAFEQMEDEARKRQDYENEKRANDRRTMAEAAEDSKRRKAADLEANRNEEAEFRRQYFAKIERDNDVELMNKKTRQKMLQEHNREVIRQWEEKRAAYDNAVQAEIDEHHKELLKEGERKQIVEAETRRLLSEHAAQYANDLPKGVFRNHDDLDLVMTAKVKFEDVSN